MAQDPLGRLVVPNVEKKDQVTHKPDDIVEATDATSVAQGAVDDHAYILNAQAESREQPSGKRKSLLRIGPGLITGVADDDPSGIGTYSVAGAQFGYQLLWLAPVCVPLMIAVQEMCGRVALVTSKGLSAIIKEHYPKWLLYGVLILLVLSLIHISEPTRRTPLYSSAASDVYKRQEMCGRVALVTSKGLSAIIKEHYPKWLLYGVLILLV